MNTASAAVPRATSGLAVTSMICGILGWIIFPFLGSLLAIIFGHMARSEIRSRAGLEGDGMALAGLILGYAGLAIMVLAVLVMILVFGGILAAAAVA